MGFQIFNLWKKFAKSVKSTKCGCKRVYWIAAALALLPGCGLFHQPGTDIDHIYSRIFLTDYNTAWQSALDALKPFDRPTQNRQGGILQTAWVDNTAQKNFTDSFGGDTAYLKARYRLNVSVAPGVYNGKPGVKISVRKEQQVQRDLLEGWKTIETDSIDENRTLYRMGRLIYIKLRLKQIDDQRLKDVLDQGV